MRFDNLNDWLRWQETLHPSRVELGLDRVRRVWSRLGPAALPFPVISIAGTNGKGSCAAMLEAVYGACGYRTTCYSSPHLLRYNERVRIDGEEIADDRLCAAFQRVDEARGDSSLTYFEFGTLAALDLFVRTEPDVAILEVGLGGRLDAVNLFDADLALITSIGRDHTAWLGETLDEIAREKAGILRAGRPAVIGRHAAIPSLLERGDAIGSRLYVQERDFDWESEGSGWRWRGPGLPSLPLAAPALRGRVQYDNAAVVLMCVSCLQDRLPVQWSSLRRGLQRTRLPGRFQVLPGTPTWILDVAHNPQAAAVLSENLRSFPRPGRVHAVLGMLSDKEPDGVATPLMDLVDSWHLGTSDDPRAMAVGRLSAALRELAGRVELYGYETLEAALSGAQGMAGEGDCILVFGSFTTVEAALKWLA